MKYIAMLSGGQDSTAMTLRLLELGEQVDYIIFSDTTLEFKEMYEYVQKIDSFLNRKYNKKITILQPKKSYEEWVFGEVTSGETIGKIRGVPLVAHPCYWRREAKDMPFQRWVKDNNIGEYKIYVGYTLREYDRWKNIDQYNAIAPLVKWKWNESEVQKYLKDNMMENKLYQHFDRTGCAICQKQGMDAKYQVYKNYKDQWNYMCHIEKKLYEVRSERGEKQMPSFSTTMFTWEMEKQFKIKDKQGTFEFEFEEVQDCFCKI